MRRGDPGRSSPPRSSARSKARMLPLRPRRKSRNPLKTLRKRLNRQANEAHCSSSVGHSLRGPSLGRCRRGRANEAKPPPPTARKSSLSNQQRIHKRPVAPACAPPAPLNFHRLSTDVPHGTSQVFHSRVPIPSAPYHPGCYSGTSYFNLCLIVNCKSSLLAASASSA
jgi:hypothetical protein